MDALKIFIYLAFLINKISSSSYRLTTLDHNATAGLNFTFICKAGKPYARFSNDQKLVYCTIEGIDDNDNCKLDSSCPKTNTYSCSSSQQTFKITLPGTAVNDNLHGSTWICGDPFGDDTSPEVELYVNIPITDVTLSGGTLDGNQVEIVTDTVEQLKCQTDAGRPSSSIQWYISGTNITSFATPQADECSADCNGKLVSSSVLSYMWTRKDEGKHVYCTALNIKNKIVRSQNITVVIFYGPSAVTFSPSLQLYTVKELVGSVGPITCLSDQCKPTCITTWNGPTISDQQTTDLHLQNISRKQAGNYSCTASNSAWSNTSVTVSVIVEYGPNLVNISPSTQNYTIMEMTGHVDPITCIADCRPSCSMKWVGPNEFVRITPVLNLTNISRYQAGAYRCTAMNSVSNLTSITVNIIVQYGPREVNISPPFHYYNVTESSGNIDPINCSADCYPDCTMKWSGPGISSDYGSVLNLHTITRNQTGTYQCTASNSVSQQSVIVNVVVFYGPTNVKLSPSTTTYNVTEITGSVNPITCTADCKPDCTMHWTGPHLPSGTSSLLNLQNITRNQTGTYICVASNYISTTVSVRVAVVVHYGPGDVLISADRGSYTVNETGSITPVSCTSDCLPNCTMVWKGPNFHNYNTAVLDIRNINRMQAGLYKCTASNYVGNKESLSMNIIVNFRPDVKNLLGNTAYNENDTIKFSCDIESVPTAGIQWIFEDKILDNNDLVSVITSPNNSIIKIRRVGCLSMGTYNCSAWNIIGQDTKSIDIEITCSPRINVLEYNVSTLIAVKDQEPLNITAPILAYPVPYIYWTFVSNETFCNVTHKTSNTVMKNRLFSHLFIANVTEEDFGFYRIYAFNDIGNTKDYIHSFEVIPERKPNPPQNVTCFGRQDSVLVHWESNFNGGDEQTFQIFIQKDGDASFSIFGQDYSDPGQKIYSEATIYQLQMDSTYHIKVRASNKHNYSMSEPASCNTTSIEEDDQQSTHTIAIGAGTGIGAAVIILIIIALVFIFFRRRKHDIKQGKDKELIKRSVAKEEEDDEDGLKENPLYMSSAVENVGAVYSIVDKKRQTNKDKDKLTDDGTVYTQVVKNTKKGTNKTSNSKAKKTQDLVNKEMEMGCVYANSGEISNGHDGDMYANSGIHSKFGDKHAYTQKKNKDGLIYADLDLEPTGTGHTFVIRGLENRNNYAVIDLTKTAEPLPSDSDNEDDQTDKNIDK